MLVIIKPNPNPWPACDTNVGSTLLVKCILKKLTFLSTKNDFFSHVSLALI